MAYSSVPLVATADLWTAANHNTYLKDNMTAMWVGTTAGDLGYYTSAVAKSRLAIGAARTGLRVNSAGTAPEWGSAIQARVMRTTNQSISTATYTDVIFNSELEDTDSFYDAGSPTIFTIPYTGVYAFGGRVYYANNATGSRITNLTVTGDGKGTVDSRDACTTGLDTMVTVNAVSKLSASDTVKINVWQSSGGALNIVANTIYMWIVFLGP